MISAADFEIINTDYTVDEARSNENTQYYTIFLTIKNTKTTPSNKITIEILDEWELPTRKTETFQPQESKTVTFEDIPFAGGNSHQVTVKYYPSNESQRTLENQGSTTFNISYNMEAQNDSPFFQPLFLIFTIVFAAIIIKKKKK